MAEPALPPWAIGPFTRQAVPEPVIKPNPDATFENPINQELVHWEKAWVYNPAAVARNGKVVVLYRAQRGPGNTCSRIGYAESDDGLHFTRDPVPVYYPAERCRGVLEKHWNGALLTDTSTALRWAATMTWKGGEPLVRLVKESLRQGARGGGRGQARAGGALAPPLRPAMVGHPH